MQTKIAKFNLGNIPLTSLFEFLTHPWTLLVLTTGVWVFSLSSFDLRAMKDWGLVSIFPASMFIAYALLLVGVIRLFNQHVANDGSFIPYMVLYIFMLHGTPQLLYGTLRYSWAWKHVGIVDYIIRHNSVNPEIGILGVYHNWPGFFALNALFTQLAGISGALAYAGWGPVFFEILFALGVLSLFRLFTPDKRLQWLAVWLFLLTNWVGQDYFSPQAMGYFMMLGVLVLVLLGFGPGRTLTLEPVQNRLISKTQKMKFARDLTSGMARLHLTNIPSGGQSTRPHQWALGIIILLCFFAIVSSHQLTPFMGLVAVIGLVFFGYIRWKTLPVWMVLFIAFWFLFPARSFSGEFVETIVESLGKVTHNVDSGMINVSKASSGQAVVAWMGRGLSAAIGLLAGFGFYRRVRSGHLDLPAVLLALSPIAMLFLSTYGGEALFRVYFFMLPFLSFFAAGIIYPTSQSGKGMKWTVALAGISIILLCGMLFAYYGKEKQYYFTNEEVEAAEYLYSNGEPGSLLVEGARNYPSQFLNYEYFNYVPIDREPAASKDRLLENPMGVLESWLSNPDYSDAYLIITRSQKSYADALGVYPIGSLDMIQQSIEKSGIFEIVFSNHDAIIFKNRKER